MKFKDWMMRRDGIDLYGMTDMMLLGEETRLNFWDY